MDGKELPKAFQTLFASERIERLARNCGCIKRERLMSGGQLAQTLVFGLLHAPEATGSQLAQTAAVLGVSISPQALEKRLDQPETADFLKAVLEEAMGMAIAAPSVTSELLQRFTEVDILDSTTATLPDELAKIWSGCGAKSPQGGKAALKVQVQMDLVGGGLKLELSAGRVPDQKAALQTQDIKEGSLHLRDLGYFDLSVLKTIDDSKAFFISRLMNGTNIYDTQGNLLDLLGLLRNSLNDVDIQVQVGAEQRLPVRLVARRLPKAVGATRRRRLRKKAQWKGRYEPTKEALALRDWSIAITNVPTKQLDIDEIHALLRLRWQIELLFKLWKSHGRLGHSRRRKAQRILAETYAKLIAMLIQHWMLWQAMGEYVDRSLSKAASAFRTFAWLLLRSLTTLALLRAEILRIIEVLKKSPRTQRRRKKPAAFQVLEDPKKYGYKACA
jgi:hypothetical protein